MGIRPEPDIRQVDIRRSFSYEFGSCNLVKEGINSNSCAV